MFDKNILKRTFWILVLIERNSKFGDLLQIKMPKKIEQHKIKKKVLVKIDSFTI